MSDNVAYTPGSGATIAADEIGGVLFQRAKLVTGVDGEASDVSKQDPMPIAAYGELIEAIEAMRMAIQSLNRSIGMAQVNPLTGRMLVDGSGVTQPVSGTVSVGTSAVSQSGTWNQTQIGGQSANSVVTALERSAADNLRRNIIVT
jgi:hypothetical protein